MREILRLRPLSLFFPCKLGKDNRFSALVTHARAEELSTLVYIFTVCIFNKCTVDFNKNGHYNETPVTVAKSLALKATEPEHSIYIYI